MENISIQQDVKEFIDNNATKDVPPYKFEFVPFISEIDNKGKNVNIKSLQNTEYNENITTKISLNSVKSFINNVFFTGTNNAEKNQVIFNNLFFQNEANDSKIFNDIQKIIDKSCINEDLNPENKTNVKIFLLKIHKKIVFKNIKK